MTNYVYTFGFRPEETPLCQMEMRAFFGQHTISNVLISDVEVEPSRSPFIRERLQVLITASSIEEICEFAQSISLSDQTFRIVSLHKEKVGQMDKFTLQQRRNLEKTIALCMDGQPDLKAPQLLFGIVKINDLWYFGKLKLGEAVWLKHQAKPQNYSTALSSKVARAITNVAIPQIDNKRAIDPCCGIGTVLIEALSMGIQIVGRDENWFVTSGSRKNIAHFGYTAEVQLGPIEEVEEHYDVAIIDMPYNVFTHSSKEDNISILSAARRIASRVVVVTIESLDNELTCLGFTIKDRCFMRKGNFQREIIVCE